MKDYRAIAGSLSVVRKVGRMGDWMLPGKDGPLWRERAGLRRERKEGRREAKEEKRQTDKAHHRCNGCCLNREGDGEQQAERQRPGRGISVA